MTVAVLAFAAYLGVQLLRFAKPPTIAVTDPTAAVVDVDESATEYVLRGTSNAGATISIATPGRDPYSVSADADGKWNASVELRRGRNQFEVTAVDPDTGKKSETAVDLFITVPFLVIEAPDAHRRPTRRERDLRERRDPGPGTHDECLVGRRQRGLLRSCHARHWSRRHARATGRPGSRHGPGR